MTLKLQCWTHFSDTVDCIFKWYLQIKRTNLTLRKEQKAGISVPAIFTQLKYFGFPLVFSRAF